MLICHAAEIQISKGYCPAPSFSLSQAALRCDNTTTVILLFIVSLDTHNKHRVPPPCVTGRDVCGGGGTPFTPSNLSIAWLYADRWFQFELHAARTLISDSALDLSTILIDNGVEQAARHSYSKPFYLLTYLFD